MKKKTPTPTPTAPTTYTFPYLQSVIKGCPKIK
jgi:hypothetical protein